MAKRNYKSFESERTTFVKNTLRRASMRWRYKNEAFKLARVERGLYACAMCDNLFKRELLQADHVVPVIDIVEGGTDWNDYINRLLIPAEDYQILCKTCHGYKTDIEDRLRAKFNQERKEKEKEQKRIDKQKKV